MMPAGGWLCDRLMFRFGRKLGLRMTSSLSLVLAAGFLFTSVNASETATVIALMSLALGFSAIADMTYWTAGIEIAGDQVGVVGGILNPGANIGGALAPVVTPWIASFAGWSWGLYFGGAVALAGALVWLFTDPTRRINAPWLMVRQSCILAGSETARSSFRPGLPGWRWPLPTRITRPDQHC